MSHLVQLPDRRHQQRTVVQFAGTHVQFAANHVVVHLPVSGHVHFVDFGLFTFVYLNIDIDRILADDLFARIDLGEQITVVLIQRVHRRHILRVILLTDSQPFI